MSKHELDLYLNEMDKSGTWGDGIVLSVAVLLYGRPIIIMSPDGHTQSIDAAVPLPDTEPILLGLVKDHYVSIIKRGSCANNEHSPPYSVCDNNELKLDHKVIGEESLEETEKLKV